MTSLCNIIRKKIDINDEFTIVPNQLPIQGFKSNKTGITYNYGKSFVVTNKSEVILYEDDNKNYIIIKYTIDDDEPKMILKMKENKVSCGVVETNYVGNIPKQTMSSIKNNLNFKSNNKDIYIIMMPFYDGDLRDLSPQLLEFKLDHKIELMTKITEQVRCLFKAGFCYTDLRFENILFKCHSKDNFSVRLGDIGGIAICGDVGVSTFPSFQAKDKKGIVDANNNSVVWGLLIVFLCMFTNNIRQFAFDVFDKLTSKKILEIIKALHTKENDRVISFMYNTAAQLMESDLSINNFEDSLHKLQ